MHGNPLHPGAPGRSPVQKPHVIYCHLKICFTNTTHSTCRQQRGKADGWCQGGFVPWGERDRSGPTCCGHEDTALGVSDIYAPVRHFPCSALHRRAPAHLPLTPPVTQAPHRYTRTEAHAADGRKGLPPPPSRSHLEHCTPF